MSTAPSLFNQKKLHLHAARSYNRLSRLPASSAFLINEAKERLTERLDDLFLAHPVTGIVELGYLQTSLQQSIQARYPNASLVRFQPSSLPKSDNRMQKVIITSPSTLTMQDASANIVLSNLFLHQINELIPCLAESYRILKPGGFFLATLFGGATLTELRKSLLAVEITHSGGTTPRLAPSIDTKDAGMLLTRSGFTEVVADYESLRLGYTHVMGLVNELRTIGHTNHLNTYAKPLSRSFLKALNIHYCTHFPDGEEGLLATFGLITLTGWKA